MQKTHPGLGPRNPQKSTTPIGHWFLCRNHLNSYGRSTPRSVDLGDRWDNDRRTQPCGDLPPASAAMARRPENQWLVLVRVAERRVWIIVHTYADQGISGAKGRDQRPAFDQMLEGRGAATVRCSDGLVN